MNLNRIMNKSMFAKKLNLKKKIFSSFSLPNNKPRIGLISYKNKVINNNVDSDKITGMNENIERSGGIVDKKLFFVVKK